MELWGTRDNEKSLRSERELLAQQPVRVRERSAFLYSGRPTVGPIYEGVGNPSETAP